MLPLLLWLAIALALRFMNLAAKPPWNDELATLVFSLGNSLKTVPLDQVISLDALLAPLRSRPEAGFTAVIQHLMSESTHPPVYFLLSHAWLKLFSPPDELVSVGAARSLSALLGAAAVPAMYAWSWQIWKSRRSAHAAAALMAVSPYGVYLAQEARHYTLAILLIIASLSCFVEALRSLHQHQPLSRRIVLIWVAVNSLGIAVHYFFTLVLAAEAIVLATYGLWALPRGKLAPTWRSILISAIGTLLGLIVWIPVWQRVSDNDLTTWIYDPNFLNARLAPLGRLLVWICTMLTLLPVEGTPKLVAIASATAMLLFLLWAGRIIWRGLRQQRQLETVSLLGLLGAIVACLLSITYGLGADLTIAARYQFVYFPVLLLLVAVAIAHSPRFKITLAVFVLLGSLGGLTVVANYGYQKPDRPDLLVPVIKAATRSPTVVVATAHKTHEQTRELMGLALEFHRSHHSTPPQFLLAHLDPANSRSALTALEQAIAPLPRPLDLWLVNFLPAAAPAIAGCDWDIGDRPALNGYKHRLYRCPVRESNEPVTAIGP